MPIREVSPAELEELSGSFSRSQPFTNLKIRLQDVAAGASLKLVWLLQKDYRSWDGDDIVLVQGAPVLTARSRCDRLFAGLDLGSDIRLLAAISLHHRDHGAYGVRPVNVGRTTIIDPELFIGKSCYLLKERYDLFIPKAGVGRVPCWTFPFAQQDSDFHRCMDVAVWLALDYCSRHLGTTRLPLGVFRRPETRAIGHLAPVSGLFPEDVTAALAAAGLAPAYYVPTIPESGRGVGGSEPIDVTQGAEPPKFVAPPEVPRRLRQALVARGARRQNRFFFLEALHAYLDSQIPVLLVVARFPRDAENNVVKSFGPPQAHALCVIGHTEYEGGSDGEPTDADLKRYREIVGLYTSTMFLRELIVHDDDIGPFLRMRVAGPSPGEQGRLEPSELWYETIAKNALGFFVGLPPQVRMSAEDALLTCRAVLRGPWRHRTEPEASSQNPWRQEYEESLADYDLVSEPRCADFLAALSNGEIVLSLYLEHSSRLKDRALKDLPSLGEQVVKDYLEAALPKYVWVGELFLRSDAATGAGAERVFGEILVDPTHQRHDWSVIAVRFPGVAFMRGAGGEFTTTQAECRPRVQWTIRNFQAARP